MKTAVFSDIHANLEAFTAFLAASRAEGVENYVFLGDAVGYGPDPEACMELLRSLAGCRMVLGNHDSAVALRSSAELMNSDARQSVFWTMEQLSADSLALLKSLKLRLSEEDVCYSHASPESPEKWGYLYSVPEAHRAFSRLRQSLCFIGHTHWPRLISRHKNGKIDIDRVKADRKIVLSAEARYIVNCGSVGQPRDGNPQGGYCIHDAEEKTVVFRRFSYDNERTAAKIREAGLPEFHALRLKLGR